MQPLIVISGPCVIENETHTMSCAEFLVDLMRERPIHFVFKASYDKANRSSLHSFRGPGLQEGLKILEKVKQTFGVPVLTDVHSPEEAKAAAQVCDVIQIPAFLCRQTDLLVAASKTSAQINVKKGQFMAPWDMSQVVEKLRESGSQKIWLTDRGVSFGYNNLVSDFRAIPVMQGFKCPVLYDATHSVQLPGGLGAQSGGERKYIPTLSRAALAAGCNGIFAESHPDPRRAKSDAASVIPFEAMRELVESWQRIYACINGS